MTKWPAPPPPEGFTHDVVGLGECSADHLLVTPEYPAEDSKRQLQGYALQGGGQIATALVGCARLGLRSLYLGAVGDDQLGQWMIADLRQENVDAGRVVRVAGAPTRSAFIVVAGGARAGDVVAGGARAGDVVAGGARAGDVVAGGAGGASRTILFQRDPRLDVPLEAFGAGAAALGRVLHLDATVPATSLEAARQARQAGAVVMLDIDHVFTGMEPLLEACDLVVASSSFARQLGSTLEAGLRQLERLAPGFVCCTAGAEGSLAVIDGQVHREPGFVVPVVDTTGAGDIYHAGFVHGLLQGWPPATVMRFANAAAALKCQKLGGRPGAPTLAAVEALLGTAAPRP